MRHGGEVAAKLAAKAKLTTKLIVSLAATLLAAEIAVKSAAQKPIKFDTKVAECRATAASARHQSGVRMASERRLKMEVTSPDKSGGSQETAFVWKKGLKSGLYRG